jgi:hypothetical protein
MTLSSATSAPVNGRPPLGADAPLDDGLTVASAGLSLLAELEPPLEVSCG